MTGTEIIKWMAARGVRLWAEGGKLRISATPGTVTPKVRERLGGNKGAIMAALTGQPQPAGAGHRLRPRRRGEGG